jgi:hypothetical protein
MGNNSNRIRAGSGKRFMNKAEGIATVRFRVLKNAKRFERPRGTKETKKHPKFGV